MVPIKRRSGLICAAELELEKSGEGGVIRKALTLLTLVGLILIFGAILWVCETVLD